MAADQQHTGDRQAGQGRHRRHVAGLQPGGPDALPEDPLGAAPEAGGLVLLLGERLDHPHADHVLLGLRGHVGDPLLHLLEDGVADPRVPVGHHHQHRRDGDRDQHQLDVQQRERDQHDHHRQHVLAEEDQAVAEEEPHRLQVDGRAGHQLAGLVAVEEPVGQPLQVGVHAVSQVELDGQRQPAGEPAAEEHEHALERAHRHDQRRQLEQQRAIPVRRRIDRAAGQIGDRERADLGRERQQHRRDDLPAIRPEKAEQAAKDHPAEPSGIAMRRSC